MVFGMWTVSEGLDQVAQYEEEDEDQYESEDPNKRIRYQLNYCKESSSVTFDTIVIGIGNAANAFLETYIELPAEYLAEFVAVPPTSATETPSITSATTTTATRQASKKSCFLFQCGTFVLCMVKYKVEAKDAHGWINTLMSQIDAKNVVVLCSSPKSMFVGDEGTKQSDADILRCLNSSRQLQQMKIIIPLEEGNIVNGLPAAVMSYCEAFERACVLYVAYTESHYVDVFTLKCYQPALTEGCLGKLKQVPKTKLTKRLREFEGCGVADNNVYI